jgi:O-antigen/teichoic acid export membrane protein
MEEQSLSYKTLRNSVYLFLGFALPMAFTIFVIRQLSAKLGTGEFGTYLFVNAISAFVGFVDLGLSYAITKYVAEYHSRGDNEALQNILSSARLLFFITGLLGLAVFLVIGRWFLPLFKIPEGSLNNIFIVFCFAGLAFFFNSVGTIYSAVLTAMQRFDLITKISLVNLVFTSIGTIILLQSGFHLKVIMAWNAFSVFVVILVYRYFSRRLMPQLNTGFKFVKAEIIKAYKFGLLIFISNLANSCLVYLDRLLIPIFLGPAQLAYYSIPGNVALKIPGVTNSLAGMLFPMSSALSGSGDTEKLKIVYIRVLRNLSVIAAGLTVSIILFANKILFFWLGPEYAQRGTGILIILALTYYLIALYQPLQGILQGIGKLKFLIVQSIIMAVSNLILLLVLVPRFGIVGAAWAYLISVIPMVYAFYWIEKNIFGFKRDRISYYFKLYCKLLFVMVVDVGIIYFLLVPFVTTIWRLVVIGPLSVLLYLALYYVFRFFDSEDEEEFKKFAYKFLKLENKFLKK